MPHKNNREEKKGKKPKDNEDKWLSHTFFLAQLALQMSGETTFNQLFIAISFYVAQIVIAYLLKKYRAKK